MCVPLPRDYPGRGREPVGLRWILRPRADQSHVPYLNSIETYDQEERQSPRISITENRIDNW